MEELYKSDKLSLEENPSLSNTSRESEEEICRICRCPQESDRPLYHPCICAGSIKYVHEDCLMQWLSHASSGSRNACELCGHSFGFTPVYEPGAPKSLAPLEIVWLSLSRAIKLIPVILRFIMVGLTWGIFIPLATCIMLRIFSLGRINESHMVPHIIENSNYGVFSMFSKFQSALEDGFVSSWGIGVSASASIFVSFLTLISVVDFVREHDLLHEYAPLAAQNQEREQPNGQGDEEKVEEPVDQQNPDHNDNNVVNNGNAGRENENQEALPNPEIEEDDVFADGNNGGEINVALDELLGLRGPGWVLFHNVLWVLTFNGLYLILALFVPTSIGAIVITAFSRLLHYVSGVQLISIESESFLLRTFHKHIQDTNAEREQMMRYTASRSSWFASHVDMIMNPAPQYCSADNDEGKRQFLKNLRLTGLEISAEICGYVTVAYVMWSLYRMALYMKGSASEASSKTWWTRLAKILRLMNQTLKVVIIVFLKMGVFPVLLGCLLELATRNVVHVPAASRIAFATDHPLFAVMVLWVGGITHMLLITVVVLELRDILHPDILHGIIRPKDTDDSLLRTVLEESVVRHIRRMALSCAIYTFLVVAFIYAPTKLIENSPFHTLLPIQPRFHYVLLELQLPVELIAIHVGVLNLLDYGKDAIRVAMERWFLFTCTYLGLEGYILPIPETRKGETTNPPGDKREPSLKPRQYPRWRWVGTMVLLFCIWATCLIMALSVIIVPYTIGRVTVRLLQMPVNHQPLEFAIGCVVIWRAIALGQSLIPQIRRSSVTFGKLWGRIHAKFVANAGQFKSRACISSCAQWIACTSLAVFLIPTFLGIFVQLAFVASSESIWPHRGAPIQDFMSQIQDVRTYLTTPWSSFLYNWVLGWTIQLIATQLILLSNIIDQREVFQDIQRQLLDAWQTAIRNYDCSILLYKYLMPLVFYEMIACLLPVILVGFVEQSMMWIFGVHLSSYYGFLILYRVFAILVIAACAVPYVAREIEKAWCVVHDALRDERYLVGKRLHNLEKHSHNNDVVM